MSNRHPLAPSRRLLSVAFPALFRAALLSGAVVGASGCTIVMQQAPPTKESPLKGKTVFFLEEVDFTGVDAEAEHVEAIKKSFAEEMRNEGGQFKFESGPGEGVVVIRTKVTNVDKGISMGIGSTDSKVEVSVQFVENDAMLDTRSFAASVNQKDMGSVRGVSIGGYTDTDRLEEASERVASQVVEFLRTATRG